jgi:hypothetical protein
MSDRLLTGKALKALFRELAHDYGLRRLQERGVRYEDAPNRPLDRAQDREALRETHRLNYEIGYAGFRLEYVNDSDTIKEWPDPATRERELRSFWFSQAEQAYPSYRDTFAGVSTRELKAYRDDLLDKAAGSVIDHVDFYHRTADHGRRARFQAQDTGKDQGR